MSIVIALTIIVVGWHAGLLAMRLAVDLIATVIGTILFVRVARTRHRIVAMQHLDVSRPPTRAQRRLLAAGLKLAIEQAAFRSLLPATASRAERIAVRWAI